MSLKSILKKIGYALLIVAIACTIIGIFVEVGFLLGYLYKRHRDKKEAVRQVSNNIRARGIYEVP
jgi:hypothetical protein